MAETESKNNIGAVKRFFEDGCAKVSMGEMTEFWKACTAEEKKEFSDAATALGYDKAN